MTSTLQVASHTKAFLQEKHLGAFFGEGYLHTAFVSLTAKNAHIELLSSLEKGGHVKPLDTLAQHIAPSLLDKTVFATAFPMLKTLSKALELQRLKTKELDAVIKYQIESQLPYPIQEAIIDKILLEKASKTDHYLILASRKEDLRHFLDHYQSFHIDPEIVAPKAIALVHFAKLFLPELKPRILIDITAEETVCLLLLGSTLLTIRSLPIGIELADPDQEEAAQENHLQRFARELTRILLSFQQYISDIKSVPIVFTGTQERDPLILSLLAKLLGHEAERITHLPEKVTLAENISLDDCAIYATAIGVALMHSPFHRDDLYINLRKDAFAYPRKWRRWKKEFGIYFGSMLLASTLLYGIGEISLQDSKRELQQHYANLVSLHDKTFTDVETHFATERNQVQQELIAMTPEDIENRYEYLKTKYSTPPELIALHPNIPRVADLLAWLCNQKIFKNSDAKQSPLQIENLTYTMVKRPDKEHPKEHYQVRVDLEVSAQSAEIAREFYNTLNTANPFVDARQEVRWNAQRGHYLASFYLKDRTEYP